MPIITTRCSRIAQIIDSLLTAIAWCGFFYLVIQGVSTLFASTTEYPDGFATQFPLIMHTLAIYLAVAAFNAMILVLWAKYHKIFFRKLGHRHAVSKLDDETLASSFSLSCQQLREMQYSRMAVIHHTPEGNIAGMETRSPRPQLASNSDVFHQLHSVA